MSGHHPWPPGKLHNDMEKGRKEIFRLGNWSIFASGAGGRTSVWGITDANWDSFVFHCGTWEQWESVHTPVSVNTLVKGQTVEAPQQDPKQELTRMYCRTNMIPHNTKICPGCRMPIPHEIVALWTLQNFDRIQEVNSE